MWFLNKLEINIIQITENEFWEFYFPCSFMYIWFRPTIDGIKNLIIELYTYLFKLEKMLVDSMKIGNII